MKSRGVKGNKGNKGNQVKSSEIKGNKVKSRGIKRSQGDQCEPRKNEMK